ncbi:MAG: hypothetical protein LW817_05075 [Candidatus Caenarcaniphilales bacterium]|jgi:hypothetical protein|nr:hypothetical protein [Candidatus Caenarcaniphilales bacterium]
MSNNIPKQIVLLDDEAIVTDSLKSMMNVIKAESDPTVKTFPNPNKFAAWLEDQRNKGVDLAKEPPMLIISDGQMHRKNDVDNHIYTSTKSNVDKYRNIINGTQDLLVEASDLPPYLLAHYSGSLVEAPTKIDESGNFIEQKNQIIPLNNSDNPIRIAKPCSPNQWISLLEYFDSLIQEK